MTVDPVLQAVILGILQGLTEFLPISSSAHLLLVPWLFGWEPFGVTFDVMLHGGTLLAVVYFFRQDLKLVALQLLNFVRGQRQAPDEPDLFWPIVLGTLPAALVGAVAHRQIEDYFRHPAFTVVTLSLFGVLLWWIDRRGLQSRTLNALGWRDGVLIGVAQVLAFAPGASRSGVTITAALLLGFSRVDSARFSFLLAVPIIGLATLSKLYELWTEPSPQAAFGPLLVGVVVSFLGGFLCIKYFLRYLQTRSYAPFAAYRLALAGLILLVIYWG